MVVPQNGWFIMENPCENGWFGGTDLGIPLFQDDDLTTQNEVA